MATDRLVRKTKSRLDGQGRLLIPAEIREQLGMKSGETVFLRVRDHLLEVWTPEAGWQMAQAIAERYATPGQSVVDELIADRRAEAQRE